MSDRKLLVGLIGANIMGSLSPALFADAFAAAGIDGFYHLMDVDRLPGRRSRATARCRQGRGLRRHKHHLSVQAGRHCAARCRGPAGRTDRRGQYRRDRAGRPHHRLQFRPAAAFAAASRKASGATVRKGATVVLVGAGGAGRAVAFALMDLGVAALDHP